MNYKERINRDIFTRVGEFGTSHRDHFTPESFAGTLFSQLSELSRDIDRLAAAETSHEGGGRQKQVFKSDAREALRDQLRAISRTARAIGVTTPTFEEKFILPTQLNDGELLDRARAFATDAAPFVNEFVTYSLPADFIEKLNGAIADFEATTSERRAVRNAHGDTASAIDEKVERGVGIVRQLDAIVRNTFRDDATVTAWKRASRSERRSRTTAPEVAAAATA
jgi:hypothetical protein